MSLGQLHQRMLYEMLPDMFPPLLTNTEIALWEMHYKDFNQNLKVSSGR